jgi:hypothetical protein
MLKREQKVVLRKILKILHLENRDKLKQKNLILKFKMVTKPSNSLHLSKLTTFQTLKLGRLTKQKNIVEQNLFLNSKPLNNPR